MLGSQGDAGQFRTPRHIIDFIVEIIDPKKDETVLDPACGTAGFLISSYKHILAANSDEDGMVTLSPDERARLVGNLRGYDISPDMVRLSLANMYMHGFPQPNIYEYDTLTSEDRWNEYADVILANPPFMNPKGGIRPHNLFSIKARRSEVLFVDYIAEHLTPSGRAGVIVPEGIIFQSQNAHKQLRKMLVEECLVAVISLPAGVFNPYSGVKTSILILDKSLAKRTDSIAFFKVENDGYDLGAQRRPIEDNDLPQVQTEVVEYLDRLRTLTPSGELEPSFGLVVARERVASDGDYNLSGERYQEVGARDHTFPPVAIKNVCTINPSKRELANLDPDTRVSFVPMSDINEHSMTFQPAKEKVFSEVSSSYTYFADDDVLLAKVTPCFENGKAGIARELSNGIGFGSSEFYVLRSGDMVLPDYLYFCVVHPIFRKSAIEQMTGTGGLQRVPRSFLENFEIPLPPLEVQREIVAEIEGYQKVIDGARAVIENYRPHIAVDPEWPMVKLGEVCEINPESISPSNVYPTESIHYIDISSVESESGRFTGYKEIPAQEAPSRARRPVRNQDVLLSTVRPNLKAFTILSSVRERAIASTGFAVLRARDGVVEPEFILESVRSDHAVNQMISMMGKGSYPSINQKDVASIRVPVPTLSIQQKIVAEFEGEKAIVDGNRKLVARMEEKIAAAIGRVWESSE